MLSSPILPFCQLQFDAAVAGAGFLRVACFERLELAKAGSHEALGRYALGDQELHHRDGALGGKLPVVADAARA